MLLKLFTLLVLAWVASGVYKAGRNLVRIMLGHAEAGSRSRSVGEGPFAGRSPDPANGPVRTAAGDVYRSRGPGQAPSVGAASPGRTSTGGDIEDARFVDLD